MNIFDGLQKYAARFQVKDSRVFNAEELSSVSSAKVVASQYGMSICFFMKDGCQKYVPVSRDSVCQVGDTVDMSTAKVLILSKDGSDDIIRVEV